MSGTKHLPTEWGQTVALWQIFLLCSLNISGDISDSCIQQQPQIWSIHELWQFLWSLNQIVHLTLQGFEERDSLFVCLFVSLSDSKSGEWKTIGDVSLEICSQTYEETRRIQDPVQLQVNNKTSKVINRTRIWYLSIYGIVLLKYNFFYYQPISTNNNYSRNNLFAK